MQDQQPGEVIIPIDRNQPGKPLPQSELPQSPADGSVSSTVTSSYVAPIPNQATQAPSVPLPTAAPASTVPEPQVEPDYAKPASQVIDSDQDFYHADETDQQNNLTDGTISWQSAEYLAHEKNQSWYALMIVGSALIAGVVYLLNRDIVTAVIILLALVGLTYFGGRKPQIQQFSVSTEGVQVGRSFYPFHDFRSFSVAEDPSASSIILMPLKRFMPAVNIYVPSEYEAQVVEHIADILPFEQHKVDLVDTIMRRLRF